MKTLHILATMLVIALMALAGCSKDDSLTETQWTGVDPSPLINPTVFLDEFNKESLTTKWTTYGLPAPVWISSYNNREGLFCVAGYTPDYAYCLSKQSVGAGWGFDIESELGIFELDPSQREIAAGIGLSYDKNPQYFGGRIASGIEMKLVYYGDFVYWAPQNLIGHAWLTMKYVDNKGVTITHTLSNNVDYLLNNWLTLKISVNQQRQVQFFVDNVLVWSPQNPLLNSLLAQRRLLIGFASPYNTGLAVHNYIKCTYPEPNSTPW